MFTVKLWSFSKKVESTAQPSGSGTEYSCNILTPADITAPQIEITAGADLTGYNYAYISNFHRYYWIEEISFDKGIWQLALQCDVLATYKTEIGAQSLYVLRSSAASDGTIIDNYYPPTDNITYEGASSAYPSYSFASGYYVVNIAGGETAGGSTLWQMTPANYQQFLNELYTKIDSFQGADIMYKILQIFGGNPTKLINSVMWFPDPFVTYTGNDIPVTVGAWTSVGAWGSVISNPTLDLAVWQVDLDKHPQASSRGEYLNYSPYTVYELILPAAGIIQLDTTKLRGCSHFDVIRTVDAFTGKMRYRIINDPDSVLQTPEVLATISCQWGIPVALNGSTNIAGLASSAISTTGGIIGAASSLVGVIGAVVAGIGSAANSILGASTNTGYAGSLAELNMPMEYQATFYRVPAEDNAHNGRPLMQVRQISSLSGFIMVQKGDVPIPGTSLEAEQIRAFLEGGFFYE